MIALDTAVTTIDFSQPVQVAQGSPQTDVDGARQATLMFKQGTTAQMVMPDGSTQPLSSLAVRATEYTVGSTGPAAMPAELPPTSGYTYAVELSADEVRASGAETVTFSQPVSFYVENFLGMPVGLHVPAASYDANAAAWIPSPDGRVVEMLGVTGGLADLDLNGDGLPELQDTLNAYGLNDAERTQLAQTYTVGETLWRVQLTHFSPLDLNLPAAAGPPDAQSPDSAHVATTDPNTPNGCDVSGFSVIACQDQSLGQDVQLTGVPFGLHYRSSRVHGRSGGRRLEIAVSGSAVPESLLRIVVRASVAGQTFTDTLPAAPNLTHEVQWDGLDAYGRRVNGPMPATVRVSYVYPMLYYIPPEVAESFGLPCQGDVVEGGVACSVEGLNPNARTIARTRTFTTRLVGSSGLAGGWSFSPQHFYSPIDGSLIRGDGGRREAGSINAVIDAFAGNGDENSSGDGGPATDAGMRPDYVAVGPDGSVYVTESQNGVIRRVDSEGIIMTIAGNGSTTFSGDGGPALQAGMQPGAIVATSDGFIYFHDQPVHRIKRIRPDGIVETVVGNGTCGDPVDGALATAVSFCGPGRFDVAPDGTIYVASGTEHVYRVAPNGIVHRIAGDDSLPFCLTTDNAPSIPDCEYGIPATQHPFGFISDIALGPDGSVYVGDANDAVIKRILPDGTIERLAGTGDIGFAGDGGPAVEAILDSPEHLIMTVDGVLYFIDDERIRSVGPDGLIWTAVGTGLECPGEEEPGCGDGGPALQATFGFSGPFGLAASPDGSIYTINWWLRRVRRVGSPMPGFSNQDFVVASEDGTELYEFDPSGRHLVTRDATTGAARHTFGYDPSGMLVSVTDGDGNVTTIERDGSGLPTAIVGPFGQRSTLVTDADGRITSITNPAGEETSFTYGPDGLLTSMTDARQVSKTYGYDDDGLLEFAVGPAGDTTRLSRTQTAQAFEVKRTTPLGRTTTYRVETMADGSRRHVNTDPAGHTWEALYGADGTVSTTTPDGTTTSVVFDADPRLGMQAPVVNLATMSTPSGLTSSVVTGRNVVLADPNDPLSLVSSLDSVVLNGHTYRSTHVAATRTTTSESPEGRSAVTVLDSLGRVLEHEVSGLAALALTYDTHGLLSAASQGGADLLRRRG